MSRRSTKEYMRQEGLKKIDNKPMDPGLRSPAVPGQAEGKDKGQESSAKGRSNPILELRSRMPIDRMDDPLQRRVWRVPDKWQRRIKKINQTAEAAALRFWEILDWIWYQRPWRQLTPEEKRDKAENDRRKEMQSLLKDEARLFRQRIVNRLNARGLCYRKRQYERDMFDAILGAQIQSVEFEHIVLQPDAIYFKLRTMTLPRGVGIRDLVDPDILTDLSIACQHKVRAEYTEKVGLWYIVERSSGVRGIPRHVRYQDMLDKMPASAGKFAFPAGVTENSKRIYRDLVAMPHLLIAGATNAGKSNMMHIIISSLIMRTSPADLRLIMVDLKGGMEMTPYKGIPHLLPIEGVTKTGVITDREPVPDVLDYLIREGEQRMSKITQAGVRKLAEYNKNRTTNRMPRLLLIIDEWADIRLVRQLGTKAESKLTNIASRMRAVGIHVILATQTPKREVISSLIKNNLPAKMAFSTTNITGSQLIIDSKDAHGLHPAGRYILQMGIDHLEIQAPFCSNHHLESIINSVRKQDGQVLLRGHDVSEAEVVEAAVDYYEGNLKGDDMFDYFRGRITQASIYDLLAGMDQKEYQLRGNTYIVEPPAGRSPRKLIIVDG